MKIITDVDRLRKAGVEVSVCTERLHEALPSAGLDEQQIRDFSLRLTGAKFGFSKGKTLSPNPLSGLYKNMRHPLQVDDDTPIILSIGRFEESPGTFERSMGIGNLSDTWSMILAHEARHVYQIGSEAFHESIFGTLKRIHRHPSTYIPQWVGIYAAMETVGIQDSGIPNYIAAPTAAATYLYGKHKDYQLNYLQNNPMEEDARNFARDMIDLGTNNPWLGVLEVEYV